MQLVGNFQVTNLSTSHYLLWPWRPAHWSSRFRISLPVHTRWNIEWDQAPIHSPLNECTYYSKGKATSKISNFSTCQYNSFGLLPPVCHKERHLDECTFHQKYEEDESHLRHFVYLFLLSQGLWCVSVWKPDIWNTRCEMNTGVTERFSSNFSF